MRSVAGALLVILMAAIPACGLGTESDSFAPAILITSPSTQTVRGTTAFSANVLDETGIARVRFIVDDTFLFQDTEHPYTILWDTTTVPDGLHTLRVEAYDLSGNFASVSRSVLVNNAPPNSP